jgi:hypothetical protein
MPVYRRTILFRLACDPVLRLSSGFAPMRVPANARDAAAEIYKGGGDLLSVPTIRQYINGASDRLEVSLSGVSDDTLRLLKEDRPSVRNAAADFGWALHDENWAITGVIWKRRGFADVPTISSEDGEGSRTRTISLSIRADDTFRSNPQPAYWTDADQRLKSPTDAIFSHVAQIALGATRTFGPSGS